MSSSDSSSLSEPLASDDERIKRKPSPKLTLKLKNGKLDFGRRAASPKSSPDPSLVDLGREPTPPHEYVLADNPDIAVIVIFRSRFAGAFLPNVPNVGPQDIEDGVVATCPSEVIEDLLCGLLGLVLNRKKNPERGHYNRAVEEALASQKHQWPSSWRGINPIPSSKTFSSLDPTARIDFLKTLVHWSLSSSEAIQAIVKESYKQNRHDDDVNQPLSVQPWGLDTRKRKHYLIEGQVDTPFRIYRESSRKAKDHTWWSITGNIEGAQKLARDLRAEPSQAPHRLAAKITQAIPLFEERLEKRKSKEYRLARKAAFSRPEPGMSLYEGRTRGKRMNYNYDDDEVYGTDEGSTRRSNRQSRVSTPADGPTFTASGRAVRSQYGRSYGEPSGLRNGGPSTRESSEIPNGNVSREEGRTSRSGRAIKNVDKADYGSADELGDDEEDEDVAMSDQWEGDDEDMEGKLDEDEADMDSADESDDSLGLEQEPRSLVVKLRAGDRLSQALTTPGQRAAAAATNGQSAPPASAAPTASIANGHVANPASSSSVPPPSSEATARPSSSQAGPNPVINGIMPMTLATNNLNVSYATAGGPSPEPPRFPSHNVNKITQPPSEPVQPPLSAGSEGLQQAALSTKGLEHPAQPVANGVRVVDRPAPMGLPMYPHLQQPNGA